tara:strand:- start:169 stop:1473 length:1305 start_codon:yes stop_codon:yes gene_type:complete
MNLAKNNFIIIILFLFIYSCSFDNKTSLWKEKSITENENIKIIFKNNENLIKQINSNLKIKIVSKSFNKSFVNNLNNNNGYVNYNGNLKRLRRYKFSNIENFDKTESEIIVHNQSLIFFDNKGNLLKFNDKSKLEWKKNFYTKAEKKLGPILSMSLSDNILIVADNLAKYYAIDIVTGSLIWEKRNSSSFNSQIKILNDKFYIVDYQNILRCFKVSSGEELWKIQTENSFIKSRKKLSLALSNDKIFFNNYIGDISSVNINTGEMIWQTPTQKSSVYEDSFLLETSDVVLNDGQIFLSNNRNEFFSINQENGFINWETSVNSSLRPTIIDNLIFTITSNGFLVVLDKNTGKVIRSTFIFNQIKKNKLKNIKPIGFIVGLNNIYLSTDKGYLIIIDIESGKSNSMIKIAGGKILRPYISSNDLYIIKSNSVIKFD